jgi:hypothetical protein
MSAEHYDWLTAAAKRTYRTVGATQVAIDQLRICREQAKREK